ncbi:hypothetical protein FA13DRAFT_1794850 [Coprinellus micaceus]|uniref:F-box domain-containing protein n=1 Tax=Coprinellus micaceus TaxID=71717 RepID=A0A4Y7T015_COPMI|nr:hypothetical protein FA13DRAFT_1794850 [Coprinellus micaceus]
MTDTHSRVHRRAVIFADLPTELKAIIVELRRRQAALDNPRTVNGWHTAIRDLCMVSKDLVPLCQEELFESIQMEPVNCQLGLEVHGAPDTMLLFTKLAESSPHLCRLVKGLSITIPNKALSKDIATRVASALRLMTNIETLGIGQDPRGRSGPVRCKSLFEVGRSARAPKVVDALREMVKTERLSSLLVKGIRLAPHDLMECTGLINLTLLDSDLCSTDGTQHIGTVQSDSPIYLESIDMSGDDPCHLAPLAIDQHPKLDMSRVTTVNAPWKPEILKQVLERTKSVKHLIIKPTTHDPQSVPEKGILQWLHPNSFSTLLILDLAIHFDMRQQPEIGNIWPCLRDPYLGLTSDGLLLRLTALQKLEIKLSIQAGSDFDFSWRRSFGDQWGGLDRALVASDGKLALKSLKVVSIRFAPRGEDYELDRVKKLKTFISTCVFQRQFPGLRALCARGEIDFLHGFSVSASIKREWKAARDAASPAAMTAAT